jgi:hypothetical protein
LDDINFVGHETSADIDVNWEHRKTIKEAYISDALGLSFHAQFAQFLIGKALPPTVYETTWTD